MEFVLAQISSAYNTSPDGRPSARSALQWISHRPDFLIVYDGADGHYSVVENFLPPGNGGNILITSRNIGLQRITMKENSMKVQGMEDEDAISLLLKSAMLDDTDSHIWDWARQLLSQLGGIPLAIDQAGAYMHSCGCSIENYLKLYTRHKNKLMRGWDTPGFQGASDYGTSTYGTWDISMKEIEHIAAKGTGQESMGAQTAIRILRIFAFLNHANIPQELFKNAAENYMKRDDAEPNSFSSSFRLLNHETLFLGDDGEWDKLQFLAGIKVLLSFSFINSHNHVYSMHLLVNSWSRNCIPKVEMTEQYERTKALLSGSIVANWNIDNYSFCKLLAPHIRSNSSYALELDLQKKYHDSEYDAYALVFHHIGSWDEAEKALQAAVDERKANLGLDHSVTLITVSNLASMYINQGQWNEAEKLQVDVMNASKKRHGSNNTFTLTAMNNLAITYIPEAGKVE